MVLEWCQLNHWSIFGNFKIATISRPDSKLRGYLTNEGLSGIVAAAFMQRESTELIVDTYAHLDAYLLTIILSKTGLAVAFIASDMLEDAMYLKGIIVAPGFQGHGLGNVLVKGNMDVLGAKYMGLHTQNANMDSVANQNAIYQHQAALDNSNAFGTPNPKVEIIGGIERVVHKEKYHGQSLYGDMGKYTDQNMAMPGLNYQAGDAVFFYGKRRK